MTKNKDLEKIAWAIEGLVMHSKGMKNEFFNGEHNHLSAHCSALKGFIEEIEKTIQGQK